MESNVNNSDKKVCKINDPRLAGYTKRTRNGAEQVFYTGSDSRDFDRYRAEGGNKKSGVIMHDKPDTIRLRPPERHYYAELIDGEWWWMNGCAECNGRPRDWMTYVECEQHNVCRTCGTPRSKLTATPWGGKNGWQCAPCKEAENAAIKAERLAAVADREYDEREFYYRDKVVCPHCASSYTPEVPENYENETCDVCGGKYSVEIDISVSYSTKVIGKRVVE